MKIQWKCENRRLTENEEKVKRKKEIRIAHKVANALVAWNLSNAKMLSCPK